MPQPGKVAVACTACLLLITSVLILAEDTNIANDPYGNVWNDQNNPVGDSEISQFVDRTFNFVVRRRKGLTPTACHTL
jgi:hypothetical protein